MRMKDTVGIVTGASGQVIESFVGGRLSSFEREWPSSQDERTE